MRKMDSDGKNTKSIKRQLVEGFELATQLQLLISKNNLNQITSGSGLGSGDLDPFNELVAKILGSFHDTISVLDSSDPVDVSVEGSRIASSGDDSVSPAVCNGGDSGESRKRVGVSKGKRGCYIRKKRSNTWTVEARRIDEDRYAWRKYGQKEILHTKFPRSYFRCTHKQTQGCKATKQVQRHEQDPEMFQITYIGHHTCNATDQTQTHTEIIVDLDNTLATSITQTHVTPKLEDNGISSLIMAGAGIVKEEENNNSDQSKDYCEGSSTDGDLSLIWKDIMMFDDDQHHHNHGETSNTSRRFNFIDNDQIFSLFDSYWPHEGTSAI